MIPARGGGLEHGVDHALYGSPATTGLGVAHPVAGDAAREAHHRAVSGPAASAAIGEEPLNIEQGHGGGGYLACEGNVAELAVVIATLNRPAAVVDVLRDVLAQAPADTEIAVVDQSAPGASADIAREVDALGDGRIAHLRRGPGLVEARNAGVRATSAPVVLFLDDDVRLSAGCLAGHLAAYVDPTVGGVVGGIEERVALPNVRRTQNRLDLGGRVRTNLSGGCAGPIQTLKGANMSFRRSALVQAGPFDPAYRGTAFLEDADMSVRVATQGWSLRYEPRASVVHLSLPSGGVRVGSEQETEYWRFRNTAYFMRRHRGGAAALPMALTFGAIAARRAMEWGTPGAVPRLLTGLVRGWRLGAP